MDGGGVLLERGRCSLTEAPRLEAAHAQAGGRHRIIGPRPAYTLTHHEAHAPFVCGHSVTCSLWSSFDALLDVLCLWLCTVKLNTHAHAHKVTMKSKI